MDDIKVLHGDLGALLDPEILAVAKVPSRSVTHHFLTHQFLDDGSAPKFGRSRQQTHRGEEFFRHFKHFLWGVALSEKPSFVALLSWNIQRGLLLASTFQE